MIPETIPEHDLHNVLFALDDVQEQLESLVTNLQRINRSLTAMQGYLESLL